MANCTLIYIPRIPLCIICFALIHCLLATTVYARDDGYGLWLNYHQIENSDIRKSYCQQIRQVDIPLTNSPTIDLIDKELRTALAKLLGCSADWQRYSQPRVGSLIVRTRSSLTEHELQNLDSTIDSLKTNGFLIKQCKAGKDSSIYIIGTDELGALYGTFHFLRLLQQEQPLQNINVLQNPRIKWRMLNHWDNLNRTVERGYAGLSIWNWDELPSKVDQRYTDYARANASIGINAVALNNVNASPQILNSDFLEKVRVLADVFRPYGIRVFIAVNFASPRTLGGLKTADPRQRAVQDWWRDKVVDIYKLIPDFGGFLVKANSEGQPGPQDYGSSHAEGANMMAEALAPYDGLLIWRAFVYESNNTDRVKDPYEEFVKFDGSFKSNVMLQVKNGPLDFQPREPFSPLFGAMPNTPQMMEFQITQEYLGFSTHLVYLPMLYKEVLESDTYANGKGSTVGRIVDGTLQGQYLTGMTGVANIGNHKNWTGHPFGQANWYAFGRLAWDHHLSPEAIADEWIRMTLSRDTDAVNTIKQMMLGSYEHAVNYLSPLGLTVLSSVGHHYGPQPWRRTNFHHADLEGVGYDRSSTGSNAVEQYSYPLRQRFDDITTCPKEFLAWFHHVPWKFQMPTGKTYWEELCAAYYNGVEGVRHMQREWETVSDKIDKAIHQKVSRLLCIQEDESVWWRDACLWYFGQFSAMEIPEIYEKPRYIEIDFKQKEFENRTLKHYSTE